MLILLLVYERECQFLQLLNILDMFVNDSYGSYTTSKVAS